jgi:hypothetical protein
VKPNIGRGQECLTVGWDRGIYDALRSKALFRQLAQEILFGIGPGNAGADVPDASDGSDGPIWNRFSASLGGRELRKISSEGEC